jgi:hypothetical protein
MVGEGMDYGDINEITHSIQERRGMNWHFDKEWRNWSSWLLRG